MFGDHADETSIINMHHKYHSCKVWFQLASKERISSNLKRKRLVLVMLFANKTKMF
jgi:hypothetical protein